MRIRAIAPLLAAVVTLGGCGSSYSPSASSMLASAHTSLERNDAATAQHYLDSASTELGSARDRKEYRLLTAELLVRTGRADEADAEVSDLLSQYPHDPRVQEMVGKTKLMTGEFASAVWHFDKSMNGYAADPDIRRSSDLLALARGFDSYAGGRIAAAEEHWAGIQDSELRASVLHSSAATGTVGTKTELARTYEPLR
jgi:hypothetical protein